MKYHITTFGCQANEADSERIAGLLEKIGYKKALDQTSADLLIFNTCSIRQTAEDRVFGLNKKLRDLKIIHQRRTRLGRENSSLKIILTGCMTHYPVAKLKQRLPEIDIFLPIKDLPKLARHLETPFPSGGFLPKYQSSFRAYIPVSEGCNNSCSYCIVPLARGKEIPRPAKEIICEAERLAKTGFKELWLIGQNVNSYKVEPWGIDAEGVKKKGSTLINFPKLLKEVNSITGDFWIRFTSPHPTNFSDELIQAMAESEKFGHYLNLPVQSGDNEILKKMNRPYTIEKYKELVSKIRKLIPDIALSTDVIVGFPGETKKQFENTAKLFEEIKFDMAYISQYSPRPGTRAAKIKDNVPKEEKKQREKVLTEILKKTALENNQKYVGRIEEVLIEKEKNGWLLGKNKANKTIKINPHTNFAMARKRKTAVNGKVSVRVKKALAWGLEGELCQKKK